MLKRWINCFLMLFLLFVCTHTHSWKALKCGRALWGGGRRSVWQQGRNEMPGCSPCSAAGQCSAHQPAHQLLHQLSSVAIAGNCFPPTAVPGHHSRGSPQSGPVPVGLFLWTFSNLLSPSVDFFFSLLVWHLRAFFLTSNKSVKVTLCLIWFSFLLRFP